MNDNELDRVADAVKEGLEADRDEALREQLAEDAAVLAAEEVEAAGEPVEPSQYQFTADAEMLDESVWAMRFADQEAELELSIPMDEWPRLRDRADAVFQKYQDTLAAQAAQVGDGTEKRPWVKVAHEGPQPVRAIEDAPLIDAGDSTYGYRPDGTYGVL